MTNIPNRNYNPEVYKEGFFIKSPPLHLFNNQSSWKRRHFVLSKSTNHGYLLRYLKDQQIKGHIEINETLTIKIGISDSEKMAIVKKMFKCQPSEVMSIGTETRVFYLVGRNSKEVEEWATFLFMLCSEKKRLETRNRSNSSPACLDQLGTSSTTLRERGADTEYKETTASVFNKRPNSDPTPQDISKELPIYESPRKLFLQLRQLENTILEEQLEECKEEDYYASPRCFVAQDKFLDGINTPGTSTASDDGKISNLIEYMSMGDLFSEVVQEKNQPICINNNLLTLPTSQVDKPGAEDYPQKLTPLPTILKLGETPKLSFLSVVQLSTILSKISEDTYLEQVDVHLPQNDLTHYLTLINASGYICVSQWKDPHHLGCIFHQGDYIVAVNDLHIKDLSEIFMFISRSTRQEVKLTLKRLPDSNVLHAPGCNCV